MMDADLAVEQRQPPEAEQRQAVRIDRLADDLGDEIITRADADRRQPQPQHIMREPPAYRRPARAGRRSDAHTSELPSLMRISYDVFSLTTQNANKHTIPHY